MTRETKNFKRVEHLKRCRLCRAPAQLRKGKRVYCPSCYLAVWMTPTCVDQEPVHLDGATIAAALNAPGKPVVTARTAIEMLERSVGR